MERAYNCRCNGGSDEPWSGCKQCSDSSTPAGEITRYYARAESTTGGAWKTDYVDVTDEVATLRAERDELAQITREDARQMEDQLAEVAALRAERDAETRRADDNYDAMKRAEAEVERMRPVVEAAISDRCCNEAIMDENKCERCRAVDAFRAAQQETTDDR